MSPNATLALSDKYHQVIVFTAVSPNNKNKNKINLLKQTHLIIYFPLEDEYTLLVRVVGPFCAYHAINSFINHYFGTKFLLIQPNIQVEAKLVDYIIKRKPQIKIITGDFMKQFAQNLQYKFMEGSFYPSMVDICDFLEFSHGHYQNLLENKARGNATLVIILHNQKNCKGYTAYCKPNKYCHFSPPKQLEYYALK